MRDILRVLAGFVVGGCLYYAVTTQGAAMGFAILGFLMVLLEGKIDAIARAIDGNFGALRHLQRWTDDT